MQQEHGVPFNSDNISRPRKALGIKKTKEYRWSFLKLFFLFGMLLTVVQQFPIIREVAYGEIRLVLYGLFGLLSGYCFLRLSHNVTPGLYKLFLLTIVVSITVLAFLYLLTGGVEKAVSYGGILEFIIPFGILSVSLYCRFNPRQLQQIVYLYVGLAAFMGISLVYHYGGGWAITAQYIMAGKNQVGPIIAIAAILVFFILTKQNDIISKGTKFLGTLLIMGLIASLLVLRNRSGLLAFGMVAALIMFSLLCGRFRYRTVMLFLLSCIGVVLMGYWGLLGHLVQPFYDAFIMNYDVGDLESLSAGRVSVYLRALRYLNENPFWGEIFSLSKFPRTPHNYILNKWVRYGIMGSFPMVAFYLYLWYFALREIIDRKRNSTKSLASAAPFVLLLSLITSMFEYTHPYGPGVSQIMVWFLLGQYLKKKCKFH